MIRLDDAVIARLKRGVETFEVLVDCDKALDYKNGKIKELKEVLAAEYIYKDAKKGLHASEHEMEKFFETKDVFKVASLIIKEGAIQLTKEYRNKLREEKRRRIIELIRLNAIDSKTGLPHPLIRIENAMDEARVNVDEFKSAEDQLQEIVSKLSEIIPIKFELKKFEVRVPAQFAGSCYGLLRRYGTLTHEEWGNDGSLKVVMEIPPGMTEEFFDQLNKLTHGEVETKDLGREK